MTTTSIIFMACAWGFIIVLNIYCFYKVFTDKTDEKAE